MCPVCNKELESDANYCVYCGADVRSSVVKCPNEDCEGQFQALYYKEEGKGNIPNYCTLCGTDIRDLMRKIIVS